MDINQKDKMAVLLELLNERYNASHKIRERSMRITIWILGLAVAFIWILVSGSPLTFAQKSILTVLVIILGAVTFWFIHSLEKGFHRNRTVMINLEEALGCYEEGLYLVSKTLFPSEYRQIKKKSWSSHFRSIYLLIIPVAILIIALIWLRPPLEAKDSKIDKTKQELKTQTEKTERRL